MAMFYMLKDIWLFIKERKKWWLMPIIIGLVLLGMLVFMETGSAIAPFIYSVF